MQGKAELHTLFKPHFSLFHLLKVWPKHLCAFAPLGCTLEASTSYLHNYFDIHVCPSLRRRPSSSVVGVVRPVPSHFRFLSCSEFQKPSQTATERGEAELRILNFKTTCSEFQKANQTTTEQCIFDFKTTWSEFQKPSQTATERVEAELRILNLKTT